MNRKNTSTCTQRFNPEVEKMEKSPSASVTHEVGEAPYWQPTGAGDKLQQPHPLLVVHLLYELQEGKKKEEGKSSYQHQTMQKEDKVGFG